MVCTLSIREGPEECLCQGNGCMLSPASPPWETGSEMSDSSICSQSQVQPHCCNRGSRLLPVGGNTFDPEAGFTRPPTPQWIPAPASNSWEKPPWLQIRLCDAASCRALLAALPNEAPGLGSGAHTACQPWGKGNTGNWSRAMPAARAGWHCSGCSGGWRKGLHHSPPEHPPV